jgi:hypothetical protein
MDGLAHERKGRAGAIGFFWTWAKRQVAHLQEVNGGRYRIRILG